MHSIRSSAMVLLRRVGLVVGVLAIIAGILGMHIMTASHGLSPNSHGTHLAQMNHQEARSGKNDPVGHSESTGHSGHGTDSAADTAAAGTDSGPASSCDPSGTCTTMSAMAPVCVPSPGNTSLTAPAPATTLVTRPESTMATRGPAFAYVPASPSPGELCISRT